MAYTVPKLKDFSAAALEKAAKKLLAALDEEAAEVKTESDWKEFRDRWMARKNGVLTQVNDLWLKAAPKDAKRDVGQQVNELKKRVEQAIDAAQNRAQGASGSRLEFDRLDITLPGIQRPIGAEHPVIKTMNEIVSVFRNLGYSVQEGPVIETDYYNFEALNFPAQPSGARYPGHSIHRQSGIETTARAAAAAYPYFAGADSHHGEDQAAASHCDSRQGAPQ